MKKKALAIILALCMVITMFPAAVFAAHDGAQLSRLTVPGTIGKLESTAVEPNAKSYTVSLSGGSHGETELLVSSPAEKGSEVYFLANPDDGYLAEIRFSGLTSEDFVYIGMDIWGFIMPANKVTLEVEYVAAEGVARDISVRASEGGRYVLERTSAKRYESVILGVQPDDGVSFDPMTDVTNDQGDLYYLIEDEDGIHYYELVMGSYDVNIEIRFGGNPLSRQVTLVPVPAAMGTVTVDKTQVIPGEEFIVTAVPAKGCKLDKISGAVNGNADQVKFTSIGGNRYKAVMPDADVDVYTTFSAVYYPVTVTVDTGIGGTASVDRAEARYGDTVKVTCVPQDGYRVAQVTGVSGITDKGSNTYTFPMPAAAANVHVLFLRNENPFVDVNETHFFYDSVLWAVEKGVTNGIDATHFGPFQTSNRAAVVTMLWRYAGSPEPETTNNPFTDVPASSWFTKPVLWAVENGITNGISATEFGPTQVCNRAQVVTFLYRALKASVPQGVENPFADVPAGQWFEAPVLWALANGVTTGADPTHFNPTGECLRAQFVTFLYRASLIPLAPQAYDLHWVINGFQDTPSSYGTVELSHSTAVAGETITATVIPAEGYQIDWVKCENGSEVTKVSDTEYTFVMPEGEEIFHVNFVQIPEPEPTEPVKTYTLDVHTNVNAEITYVDGKTAAAPGESIFFYVKPEAGYVLSGVSIFDPYGEIDLSRIQLYAHDDDLYEFVMIDHDIILNINFAPA